MECLSTSGASLAVSLSSQLGDFSFQAPTQITPCVQCRRPSARYQPEWYSRGHLRPNTLTLRPGYSLIGAAVVAMVRHHQEKNCQRSTRNASRHLRSQAVGEESLSGLRRLAARSSSVSCALARIDWRCRQRSEPRWSNCGMYWRRCWCLSLQIG